MADSIFGLSRVSTLPFKLQKPLDIIVTLVLVIITICSTHLLQYTVCCGWDNKFAGEQLTYNIIGGDTSSRQAVLEAMNEWTSNVNGLQFTQVPDKSNADIVVNFQNSGGGSNMLNMVVA